MLRPRSIRRFLVLSAVLLSATGTALPAAAQDTTTPSDPPTTPVPTPVGPDQPPASEPPATPQPGPVVAAAGTALGLVRILTESVPGESINDDPGFDEKLPEQALLELGMGVAVAQANSETYLAQERAIAESRPFGFAVGGRVLPTPGALAQTAHPDHPEPTTGGLHPPASAADRFVRLGLVEGRVHARWDERRGPCVQPIADARTSMGNVSAVNSLPALPSGPEELASTGAGSELERVLNGAAGAPEQLGGLLGGEAPESGALVRIPHGMQARSTVELTEVSGQRGKAVQATSRLRVAGIRVFAGTAQELRIEVVSSPILTATATGDPGTSSVHYRAPVLRISKGDRVIGELDAAHPEMELPIGVPLPGAETLPEVPLVGQTAGSRVLNLGVLRLGLGELDKSASGNELRAVARMLDVEILPAEPLGLPQTLAKVSLGEQSVRASAPPGGVRCDAPTLPAAPAGPPAVQPRPTPPLALTSAAYHTVPLFWLGTGLLLLGAVLIGATPRRRKPTRDPGEVSPGKG